MKRLKNELNALVNRGVDRHLRLAVTGLSRSGKTAFITAMVNQLLNIHAGARLPLLSAVREERLLGVKRIPQRDFGIPRFTYDEGLAQLYGDPPAWPTPTRGVSEIRLALRFKSNDSLLRHFKDTSTLYLEIVDYPGEWLLDLPMLAQDYLSWSRQMTGLLNGQRGEWSVKWRTLYLEIVDYPGEWLLDLPMLAQDYLSWSRQMTGLLNGQRGEWSVKWRMMCEGLDPLAPADENRLADIAAAWTEYLHHCKQQGLHFIQPGRFVLPGDMAGAPALQFFPWPDVDAWGESKLAQADKHTNAGMLRERFNYYCEKGDMAGAPALQFFPWPDVDAWGESKLAQADKHTNAGMLRERFNYYCEKVVKGFYKNHFLRFDRQIVLVDCLQPLNSGPQAFNDMRLALTQLMQSFHYGQRTLFRRLRFDRQIVLVDCLQPLNSGPQAFNDMRLALTQLMQSFHYGQRTLFRRLFSPVIDKLLFAATKADHVTIDQHANMVSLLQQLIQDAWQNAAFEGISMDCLGLASVQATTSGIIETIDQHANMVSLLQQLIQDAWQNAAFEGISMDCLGLASVQATTSGIIDVNGEKIPALRGNRLSDGAPLTVYPGEVPARLPGQAFWDKQGFQFEAFRPQVMDVDKPLPHIRLDAALEFLIGDKLR